MFIDKFKKGGLTKNYDVFHDICNHLLGYSRSNNCFV